MCSATEGMGEPEIAMECQCLVDRHGSPALVLGTCIVGHLGNCGVGTQRVVLAKASVPGIAIADGLGNYISDGASVSGGGSKVGEPSGVRGKGVLGAVVVSPG